MGTRAVSAATVVTVLVSLLLPGIGLIALAAGLPYAFRTQINKGSVNPELGETWWPIDYDGDGIEERLVFRDGRILQVQSAGQDQWGTVEAFNLREEAFLEGNARACSCGDLTGDGKTELAVTAARGDSMWIDVYSAGGLFCRYGPWPCPDSSSESGEGGWSADGRRDSRLVPVGVIRHPESGERLLIVAAIAGHDRGERGIFALSLEDGAEAWHFASGSNPCELTMQLVDLDLDGHAEILFTMPSPGNGRAAGGIDDAHAWIVVLGGDGRLWWLRRLGEFYHHPDWCEVFRPDGRRARIVTCTADTQGAATTNDASRAEANAASPAGSSSSPTRVKVLRDTLCVWDGLTGRELHARAWEEPFRSMHKLDEERLVVTTSGGLMTAHTLSASGKLHETQRRRIEPPPRITFADDVDGDGISELVGQQERNWTTYLQVYGDAFLIMAELELFRGANVRKLNLLRRAGERPLLLAEITGKLLGLEMVRSDDPLWDRIRAWVAGHRVPALLVLALLVLMTIGFAFARRGVGSSPPPQPVRPVGNLRDLTLALRHDSKAVQHGGLAGPKAVGRVPWLMEALGRKAELSPSARNRLQKAARDFRERTLPVIEGNLALATALRLELERVHQIRAGCERLSRAADQVCEGEWRHPVDPSHLEGLRSAVEAINGGLKAIRTAVLARLTQPLTPGIEHAVEECAESAEEADAEISVFNGDASVQATVLAYAGDLDYILKNLLENAVYAVAGRKARRVTVSARIEGRFAYVEVEDTGCGIERDQWERIFEEGVSSRPRGGEGLYRSRRLLKDLGGHLRVRWSERGRGTAMELRLLLEPPPDGREGASSSVRAKVNRTRNDAVAEKEAVGS